MRPLLLTMVLLCACNGKEGTDTDGTDPTDTTDTTDTTTDTTDTVDTEDPVDTDDTNDDTDGDGPTTLLDGCTTDTSALEAVGGIGLVNANGDYASPLCGAVLLDANWAITAAHCVDFGIPQRDNVDNLVFVDGWDITEDAGAPVDGTVHALASIHAHPAFGGSLGAFTNDIALVRLATPATGPFATRVSAPPTVDGFTVVGPGDDAVDLATNDVPRLGATTFGCFEVDSTVDTTVRVINDGFGDNETLCYGDSGAGAFADDGTSLGLVGVLAGPANPASTDIADRCDGVAVIESVLSHQTFLDTVLANAGQGCIADPSICPCNRGCLPDATCDPSFCDPPSTDTCGQGVVCMQACDPADTACISACRQPMGAVALDILVRLNECAETECSAPVGTTDTTAQACMATNCAFEYGLCFPN
jgi:hypothetical protein